ncbi:MAG: glycosyltransferase family 2 protein, partial [Patescibacteria group bacterium]
RFVFWGTWIRHGGYYPVWILRLMRRSAARCEGQLMDEHFVVDGTAGYLKNDFLHEDRRGIADWMEKHRRYAVLKAREYLERQKMRNERQETSDREQAKRAARREAYDRLPLFIRPLLYFGYTFFVKGGFLDGPAGWVYHALHGLWYPWMIDREITRMRRDTLPSR